ncbi:MAG: vanadium-dependent haloperoxidase, partial [Flavobacteriales bacterium]
MLFAPGLGNAQHSLVRVWNDQTLKAIRNDLARPPVHARNLFHVNAAMYDAWAAYTPDAQPWLLGRTNGNYTCPFPALPIPLDRKAAQQEAMSFATYRILRHRFLNSPGFEVTSARLNHLMDSLGYDRTFTGMDPSTGGPAALGNYIAHHFIAFGLQDGSNEPGNYANQYYTPSNASLQMVLPGNPAMANPNRWQPITLPTSIDQAGNPVSSTPPFVGAEWGNVHPFSLTAAQSTIHTRDGHSWRVYLDPGGPAQLDPSSTEGLTSFFKWNHAMVSIWQSHLDPAQDVTWDISPASIGNSSNYPTTPEEYASFYDLLEGGDNSPGHAVNPVTGQPYAPNLVDRGNYTRVLAEFWADGVDSETPPGHWFEILHNVMDLPDFHRRWMGSGPELDTLEYDVKAHFALGSAMHDAAITAWGIKGYYDSVRPVSAVRYMGDRGQCSDPQGPRYDPAGMPIIPGFIEQVMPGDPLEGPAQEHLYKIKLYTYRGPSYVTDPGTDVAGVGWILAEKWWPYQRPTFVTPPFAGYISGHSTYSRTAAEVLTAITGSPFFPGGMIEYVIPQNEFLVFEDGPDEEVKLQWATYRDASDACSLSRIWGGIHPAMDDIPGRTIGMQLGPQVVDLANQYFTEGPPRVIDVSFDQEMLGPAQVGMPFTMVFVFDRSMDPSSTLSLTFPSDDPTAAPSLAPFTQTWIAPDRLEVVSSLLTGQHDLRDIDLRASGAMDIQGRTMAPFAKGDAFIIDTRFPVVTAITTDRPVYTRNEIGPEAVHVHVHFDEAADVSTQPTVSLAGSMDPATVLLFQPEASGWTSTQDYVAVYSLLDGVLEIPSIDVTAVGSSDAAGNIQVPFTGDEVFQVDLKAPLALSLEAQDAELTWNDVGSAAQRLTLTFDEAMDGSFAPTVAFVDADPLAGSLTRVAFLSQWTDAQTCQITYSLEGSEVESLDLDIRIEDSRDP